MALDPSSYLVEVSSDKMEASIKLLTDAAKVSLSAEKLREALAAKGVTHGINDSALQKLASSPQLNLDFVVAKGRPPEESRSEEIEYKFDASGEALPEGDEAGSVDFRSIKNFNNTRAGSLVAIKHPAIEGSPGYDVLGNEFKPREGKRLTLRTGKGVVLAEDGQSATAEIDGHACLVGDRLSVLGTIDIPANVDFSIGNINFIGNVRVRGAVMPGFSVTAEGGIEIAGNVEKANIKCGGNLDIRGLVFGQGHCEIEVAGDASIGAVDQAELTIRGDLNVMNYIRHCKVAVGGKVEVKGKKGNIVGGEIAAFRGIQAPFIGNSMATLTKLTVGSNPFISSELDVARARLAELETRMGQITTALKAIEARASAGPLDPSIQAMQEKLLKAKEQIEPETTSLTQQVAELQAQAAEYKEAKIRISEIVYSGVVINFRDRLQYKTMDEAQHMCFYEEAAEIRTGPF
jgi:uncharacterized protein